MMLISTSVLIGAAAFTALFGATSIAIDKKLNYYNIVVDATAKELSIKCGARKISESNFKVYTRLEHGDIYLYTKGSEVLSDSKDVVTVDHKYRIKNINFDDVFNMTWKVDNDELIVTIPLSIIKKDLSVRKLK